MAGIAERTTEVYDFPQKYLVVDDELVENENDREDFIIDLGVSETLALFASNFDEAVSIIKKNSDIVICFVDSRIPKSGNRLYDYSSASSEEKKIEWGISLIPKINQIRELARIVVYSCYVSKSYLVEKTNRYNNIVGYFGKPDGVLHRKQLYLDAIEETRKLVLPAVKENKLPALKADIDSEQLIVKTREFDYSSLDVNLASRLRDRAQKIKMLLRRTAQDTLDVGRYISEVKKDLQHGQLERWIKDELGMSPVSAYRYAQVYERLSALGISDLSRLEVFSTALYEITAAKVPDRAILEMKQLAESGIRIDSAIAGAIRQKYINENKIDENITEINSIEQLQQKLQPEPSSSSRSQNLLPEDPPSLPSIKQDIIGVIRRQERWELGKHLILRADPNSDRFKEALPQNIALCLAFIPDKNWHWSHGNFKSQMTFYSQYKDLDPLPLLEAVAKIIEVTTNEGDAIAVCFIPHPKILTVVERLGCKAYIAEPDFDKCVAVEHQFQH